MDLSGGSSSLTNNAVSCAIMSLPPSTVNEFDCDDDILDFIVKYINDFSNLDIELQEKIISNNMKNNKYFDDFLENVININPKILQKFNINI